MPKNSQETRNGKSPASRFGSLPRKTYRVGHKQRAALAVGGPATADVLEWIMTSGVTAEVAPHNPQGMAKAKAEKFERITLDPTAGDARAFAAEHVTAANRQNGPREEKRKRRWLKTFARKRKWKAELYQASRPAKPPSVRARVREALAVAEWMTTHEASRATRIDYKRVKHCLKWGWHTGQLVRRVNPAKLASDGHPWFDHHRRPLLEYALLETGFDTLGGVETGA